MNEHLQWSLPVIPPPVETIEPALRARINNKTKPLGSLGRLEEIALQLGRIQGTVSPKLTAPTVLVFVGDHGFAREGVSPYPPEVTPQMVLNFLAGGAGINVFARMNDLRLKVVDAGVACELPKHPALLDRKVRLGTRNALHEAALDASEVLQCLHLGGLLVKELNQQGCNALLPGELGIGNSSAAALLYHALLGLPLEDCVGVGAGHTPEGVVHKLEVLTRVRTRHAHANTPLTALACFGGCEIAMMTGAMLEAASRRMLLLVDGIIATAAFVTAFRLNPAVLDYAIFAHASGDGPHRKALQALNATPLLDLGMRLGEGTGAAMAWPIIKASIAFLDEMATFDSAGVSQRN